MTDETDMTCPLCGEKDPFTFTESDSTRWMFVGCFECNLQTEILKADYYADADKGENRITAIEAWILTAEWVKQRVLEREKEK